jgi:hypothetical protein
MLALNSKAKQANIQFTKDDLNLVISQVEGELTENERELIPKLLSMLG